jgi:Domain of unknown function (DUF6457)
VAGNAPAMDAWLTRVRDAVADTAGLPVDELDLDGERVGILLDLARIAAHKSGDRTNAPLLCYLLGKAEPGASLAALAEAVRRTA